MRFTVFALQPSNPIMVRVAEEAVESTTVTDVLIGSLGLTGALLLAALVLGLLLGATLIGIKLLRTRLDLDPAPDSLRVTPGA
jgi:hypothetical protein